MNYERNKFLGWLPDILTEFWAKIDVFRIPPRSMPRYAPEFYTESKLASRIESRLWLLIISTSHFKQPFTCQTGAGND